MEHRRERFDVKMREEGAKNQCLGLAVNGLGTSDGPVEAKGS